MNAALKKAKQQPNLAKPVVWAPRRCGRCGLLITEQKTSQNLRLLSYPARQGRSDRMLVVHKQCAGGV